MAGADLVAAGACLYVLLPPDSNVTFIQFLPTYLMAMVAVVLTHVPGGAGVLEVVILHLTTASPQNVFAALLCFRVIYYLLPLLLAAILFAFYEIRQQTNSGVLMNAGRWMRAFAPTIMAFAAFAGGMILCFTALIPTSPEQMLWMQTHVPAGVSVLAAALGGLSGVALLFYATGMVHRQTQSFKIVLCALVIGMLAVLLESFNWIVAILLAIIFLVTLSVRTRCRRPSSIWKLHLSPRWTIGGLGVILASAGVGLALHHPEMGHLFVVLATELLALAAIAYGYVKTAHLRKKTHEQKPHE